MNVDYDKDYDKNYDDDKKEDDGLNRKKLATENWDAPVIVTTNVQFLNPSLRLRPAGAARYIILPIASSSLMKHRCSLSLICGLASAAWANWWLIIVVRQYCVRQRSRVWKRIFPDRRRPESAGNLSGYPRLVWILQARHLSIHGCRFPGILGGAVERA